MKSVLRGVAGVSCWLAVVLVEAFAQTPAANPAAVAQPRLPEMVFYAAKGGSNSCGHGCNEWIVADGTIDGAAGGRLGQLPATAFLLEEKQGEPLGKRDPGFVTWRTRMIVRPQPLGSKLAVEAKIEIPQRQLTAYLSMAPKDDTASSPNYIIQVLFTLGPDFAHESVSSLSRIVMKLQESWQGVPLVGYSTKVSSNHFAYELSNIEPEKQMNFRLLNDGAWFDIPIAYGDGRRAIITFYKGADGARAFSDAFAAWGQHVNVSILHDNRPSIFGPVTAIIGVMGGIKTWELVTLGLSIIYSLIYGILLLTVAIKDRRNMFSIMNERLLAINIPCIIYVICFSLIPIICFLIVLRL